MGVFRSFLEVCGCFLDIFENFWKFVGINSLLYALVTTT